ncbi:MAG: PilZ domain-containing protein [Pseudomonadaceae bacterium]|nr:MAG: PilZ domain-containing protein [Pseudomonadaceae bacterium]
MSTDDEVIDQRDFFRISDELALEYRRLDSLDELKQAFHRQAPMFDLLTDLHVLEYESQHLLRQISERDRALAHYLKVVNKRIDLVGQALAMQLTDDLGTPVAVTISEGGMSFTADEALELGQLLALRLVLLPSPLCMLLAGKVIRCDPVAGSSTTWSIAVGFEHLADAQRQMLARHILQKQAQEIRAAKSSEGTP